MRFVWILLSLGLVIRCAPTTTSQSISTVVRGENTTGTELTSAMPADIPTPIPTATPAAILTPTLLPTSTTTAAPNPTVTPTKVAALTPTNTAPSLPSATPPPPHTPTSQPVTPPTTAVALAVPAESRNTEEQVKRGLEVYKQLYCGLCHQLDAAGTAGTFGPTHNGMDIIATQRLQEPQYTGKATTAAEYIHESIVDPKAFTVPGYEHTQHHMPIYNYLSETDVDALVQMLLQ